MISKSLATSYLFFFIIIIETNRHILSLPPKNDPTPSAPEPVTGPDQRPVLMHSL